MRKKFSIFILLIVILSMILSACSNSTQQSGDKKGKQKSKGRYIEHDIEMPKLEKDETVVKIVENKEHQLELYTYIAKETTKYNCYLLKEDDSWEKTSLDWLNNSKTSEMIMVDICLGQDGSYYACLQNISGEQKANIIKKTNEGTGQFLDMACLNESTNVGEYNTYKIPSKINVLKNGNFIFNMKESAQDSSLVIFNQKGEKIDEVVTINPNSFSVSGNCVYLINQDKKVVSYNTETKNNDQILDFDGVIDSLQLFTKDNGNVIGVGPDGIHCYSKDLSLWEKVVEGSSNSLGMPSMDVKGTVVKDGEQDVYYVAFSEVALLGIQDGIQKIKKYVYDKDASSIPEKEITVFSMEENKTIRQAIAIYQTKNTDVKINYVVANSKEGGVDSDYIRTLNTELFTGNGADILILDGLPIDSYIEKGVLTDLSDIINPLIDSGKLLSNLNDSFTKDGKKYQFPARISIPVVAGNDEIVNTNVNLQKIVDYINKNNNAPIMKKISSEALLKGYMPLNIDTILKDGSLDEKALKNFLENLKTLNDNISKDNLCPVDEDDTDLYAVENSRRFASMGNPYTMLYTKVNSVEGMMSLNGLKQKQNMTYSSLNESFIPSAMVGMNNSSKEAETAKDFIKFLFSDEIQKLNMNDGFPVLESSLKQWFQEESKMMSFGTWDDDDNLINGEMPNEEEKVKFLTLIKKCKKSVVKNEALYKLIIDSARSYLDGEKNIDQTVADISQKVTVYLTE
ncbi:ABC transporter substrate-binding protein [Anaerosacchariphilus polymeriproducens]|uniref:Carbohydrate ABC transporter substrate-binding protein n=1 Tax=Anaerosacchariphilus polymeriproducens TaxID=1812858 RepID=A0A371ARS4_9FIRM|nr:ABC transporter substrate-binding protein [Anaerosacchariphilus polymeriproducens]RDU22273.1 carbohydrate ABC transporter substrate-binding protein [Anaerosacchariphilus polymeriproducens]